MVAHLLAYDAVVGSGGGERDLHMAMGIYGVPREAFSPSNAESPQYVALGHVHKPQTILKSPRVDYCGSLLQLDFGERDQTKYVNLVEVHPRQPPEVTQLEITAGRQMIDIGSPEYGVALNDVASYRDENDRAWFRVYVDVDMPIANLPQLVREQLPSAVHVERSHKGERAPISTEAERQSLGPVELFGRFYESKLGRGHAPAPETVALFRRLLDEEKDATADA
jgi:exonuclease SbcD